MKSLNLAQKIMQTIGFPQWNQLGKLPKSVPTKRTAAVVRRAGYNPSRNAERKLVKAVGGWRQYRKQRTAERMNARVQEAASRAQ